MSVDSITDKEALVRWDGGSICWNDIQAANTQNIYWRTREGELISLRNMTDDHLRNTALMLMGMGYQTYHAPDSLKILWLSALRIEWERRRQ